MILLLNPIDDLHIFFVFFFIYDVLNTWNSGGLKWMQKLWFKTFGLQIHCKPDKSQTLVWLLRHEQ